MTPSPLLSTSTRALPPPIAVVVVMDKVVPVLRVTLSVPLVGDLTNVPKVPANGTGVSINTSPVPVFLSTNIV